MTKSLFSTEYHKNHKTPTVQILNMNTKMFFEENTLWYTHFNMKKYKIIQRSFTVIWAQITVFYVNHRKPKKFNNSKVTEYVTDMLLTKMLPKGSFLILDKEN